MMKNTYKLQISVKYVRKSFPNGLQDKHSLNLGKTGMTQNLLCLNDTDSFETGVNITLSI